VPYSETFDSNECRALPVSGNIEKSFLAFVISKTIETFRLRLASFTSPLCSIAFRRQETMVPSPLLSMKSSLGAVKNKQAGLLLPESE